MTLLVSAGTLHQRRLVASGELASLARGLRRELEPLLHADVDVPAEKALLSRAGGRCDRDGTLLAYDPFDARHRCPTCGREQVGRLHDRFRLYWHHLWLAERSVHAALLGVLLDDQACVALASTLLERYAARYLDYPNRDNVLGPSRPFFSTYLESIWLLQLVVALDLLETGAPSSDVTALGARVRERLIAPSAAIIASYDEGTSNRQVWNNAALIAAGRMLEDRAMVERALAGRSGLEAHLRTALLSDGSWYEGENYHLFAHRGLWYGVQLGESAGHLLPRELTARFQDGFAAPFRTLLPDLTYPSRRDSQYAVSVRQPRFAESCELGLARGDDERLVGMLARLYDPSVPRGATGRASSTADVERNLPATGLARADLSWRALLFARRELPPLEARPFGSDLLPAQGLGIVRREAGRSYVALDYGESGGGHGHPDRLNLLLVDGDTRWFDDPGTGSYVDASLHWYRSTLAHTAPLVDGRSQPRVSGHLLAFEDDGSTGWMSAEVELAPGLVVRRSVVVRQDHLVDLLTWESDDEHEIALPLHGVDLVSTSGRPLARVPAALVGGEEKEDGFAFLSQTARIDEPAGEPARATSAGGRLEGWVFVPAGTTWWSALAPDVPNRAGRVPLLLARHGARRGRLLAVWSWRGGVSQVLATADGVRVVLQDGAVEEHGWRDGDWRIGAALLRGRRRREPSAAAALSTEPREILPLPASFSLGAPHYRRSEWSWDEAGRPEATVALSLEEPRTLVIEVIRDRAPGIFVPMEAENPYDNEPAAINGEGVQLYVESGSASGGWLLVPVASSSEVAIRGVEGWGTGLSARAAWRATETGWMLTARIGLPREGGALGVDVLVNETAAGRERRRGQLVLSGAQGEFVYLRGDRHDRGRLLRFAAAHV